jgi:hypothetical protein
MAFPSYSQVVDALHVRFATVAALSGKPMLKYEPRSVQTTPMLYSLLFTFQRERSGQITAMRYRIMHRLLLQWQDNEQSELELMPFVNSIPHSVDQDPTLAGLLVKGVARISDAESGFIPISNSKYRCLDFYSDVLTKADFQSGI